MAEFVKIPPAMQETLPRFNSWVRKIHWGRDRLPTPVFLGFPYDSAGKESACNGRDLGLILGLGRSPGKGKATHSSILAWRIPGEIDKAQGKRGWGIEQSEDAGGKGTWKKKTNLVDECMRCGFPEGTGKSLKHVIWSDDKQRDLTDTGQTEADH